MRSTQLSLPNSSAIAQHGAGRYIPWGGGGAGDVYAPLWFFWLQAHWDILEGKKTLADDYGGEYPGEKPPEETLALIPLQQQSLEVAYGSEEYAEAYQACHGWLADKLFVIGTVGEVPQVYIAKNNIGMFL